MLVKVYISFYLQPLLLYNLRNNMQIEHITMLVITMTIKRNVKESHYLQCQILTTCNELMH